MIVNFLRKINRVPFPVASKHYVSFDVLTSEEVITEQGWDTLRADHPKYNFSDNREGWMKDIFDNTKDAQDKEIDERARDIVSLCRAQNIQTLFSIGAGAAGLEYRIAKLAPDIKITISEYAPDSVRKLKVVFYEGTVKKFDALDSLAWDEVDKNALVLLYRLDREFTPEQWRTIFKCMDGAGIKHSLFVLQYTFTILWWAQERFRTIKALIRGKHVSMIGYIHNAPSLRSLWGQYYHDKTVKIGSWQGFFLSKFKA